MSYRVLTILVIGIALACLPACRQQSAPRPMQGTGLDEAFERDKLVIVNDDGSSLDFDIYLALDRDQQRRGLMFVRKLPERTGMLFVYDRADLHSMWMKNTYISLDLVFARSDGTVSSVIHRTQPLTQTPHAAIEPVNYVLELNGGVARRYKIGKASRLVWNRPAADPD